MVMSSKDRKVKINEAFEKRVQKLDEKKAAFVQDQQHPGKTGFGAKAAAAAAYEARMEAQKAKREEILNRAPVTQEESKAQRQKRAQLAHKQSVKTFESDNLWKEPEQIEAKKRQEIAEQLEQAAQAKLVRQRKIRAMLIPYLVIAAIFASIWGVSALNELGREFKEEPITFMRWEKDHPIMGDLVRWMYAEKRKSKEQWRNTEKFVDKLNSFNR
uniref:Uncharacterized protein n=1 Tax=Magnetococcus massalia (strain MO-1) TaxID=451514 RepID=A0A1S7LGD3_MAGMO|nr:Conserved protein of unknown function [Candidatus Magnetococcus massalia]